VATATQSATRRELIARAVARGRLDGDIGALLALVSAEQVLVASYEQVLNAGVLSPPATTRANEFLAHERAHLRAVAGALARLGGTVPSTPRALGSAAAPASDRAGLRLLLALERAALSAYYAEIARLRDPGAARVAAEIMACGAQHATELRELLSPGDVLRAVPGAFVFGTP
jgi:hypothetical protein